MRAPTVLVILADGFEELEAVAPIDLLRRAGAEVTVASAGEGIHVTGRNGLTVHATASLASAEPLPFDCVLIPGGPAVGALREDARVAAIVRRQDAAGLWIAAICAAPVVLQGAGVLAGRRFTAHFS